MRRTNSYIHPSLIVAAGTLIMLVLGVAYVWGVYVDPLIEEFGWSGAQASLPFSIFLLLYTIGMILGGWLQDLYGPRPVCLAGAVIFSSGYLLSGFSTGLIFLCLTYGVLGGLGTGFAYVTPVTTVVKWFPERKGLMSGLVIFGFGAGSFILSPLANFIIEVYGWQTAFLSLGVGFLGLTTLASTVMVLPPKKLMDENKENNVHESMMNLTPLETVQTSTFWLAWTAWFLALTVGLGTMGHVVYYAEGTGVQPMAAAFILSVIAVFNGLGRVSMGAISDEVGHLLLLGLACLAMGSSAVMFNLSAGLTWAFYLSGVVFGLAFGALLILYPVVTSDLFGIENMGANYGLLFSSYGIGGLLGPVIYGQLYDIIGDYNLIFLISTIGCSIAVGLVLLLRMQFKKFQKTK